MAVSDARTLWLWTAVSISRLLACSTKAWFDEDGSATTLFFHGGEEMSGSGEGLKEVTDGTAVRF